jgi:hypothetical protein
MADFNIEGICVDLPTTGVTRKAAEKASGRIFVKLFAVKNF